MIEHYVSFLNIEAEKKIYQIYVTDALKVIASNAAHKKDDLILDKRWIDLIKHEKKHAPEEEKTADEIIADISGKLKKFCRK